jgi:hypothetical protein
LRSIQGVTSRARSNPAYVEILRARRPALTVAWRAGSPVPDTHATGQAVEADAVFHELDGVELLPEGPHLRVYSIFDTGDVRWIQYALEAPSPTLMGTLRLTVADSPEQVVRTLRAWLVEGEPEASAVNSTVLVIHALADSSPN